MEFRATRCRFEVTSLEDLRALDDPKAAVLAAMRDDHGLDPDDPWRRLDLDTVWNGLHFALTGRAFGGEPPVARAVYSETGSGIASICHVSAQQAGEIASALAAMDDEAFLRQIQLSSASARGLHCAGKSRKRATHAHCLRLFHKLRAFHVQVTRRGAAVPQRIA
jgi:hypothetical protein